jgi:hypothetical protein
MQTVSSICRRSFLTDLSFSAATGASAHPDLADAIIGLEPSAVTESRR